MKTKKTGRVHTALRITHGIIVLLLLVLASSSAGPVLTASGSGGGTPPPPPDFLIGLASNTGLLVPGGFPTCPAYYGCNPTQNWEPREQVFFDFNTGYFGQTISLVSRFAGMFIGFFTSACPICAPLLVSLLGISAPLAFILGKNLWLEIASIMLLLFALYKLSDSMDKCQIRKKTE